MVSAAMSCVKYLLYVFNLIFALIGIASVVAGIIFLSFYKSFVQLLDDKFSFIPIGFIIAGIVVFFVAFFGCCGAAKENHCMVSTFASLLLIIFILEVAGGIACYVYRNDIKKGFDETLDASLKNYKDNPNLQEGWDILQADFRCCGINSTQDWINNGIRIPNTCCPNIATDETCTQSQTYKIGCLDQVEKFLDTNALIIGGVCIGIAVIELIGVIFACCLACSIRKEYESV